MAASEDFIDTFYKSIRDLHSVRVSLEKDHAAELVEILKRAAKDISDHTGKFLHKLHEQKPDEDILQTMISASPSSLIYTDEGDQLPIQSAVYHPDRIHYIPFLAKEGVKHKVGGEDGRGGLLVDNPLFNSFNTLQGLGVISSNNITLGDKYDKAYVDVMKELKEANLLTKDDIEDHDLLYLTSCSRRCKQRFDFLCDWCPEGLKHHRLDDDPVIHASIQTWSIKCFAMFLKAATKYYKLEASLLFQTDNDGITACERAFEKFGRDKVMQIIGDCMPFDNPQFPILHHVAKHAPQLLNDFSTRYTSSIYVRDKDGRTLNQALLASGKTLFKTNGLYFLSTLRDDDIKEIDPPTDLYPFMVAASGNTSDLSAVYVLLRRNPSLVRGGNIDDRFRRRRRRSTRSRHRNSTKRIKTK